MTPSSSAGAPSSSAGGPPSRTQGPWPKPSPIHPKEMPAAVCRIPLRERLDFHWHIGRRYYGQLFFYWMAARRKVKRLGYPHLPTDDRFVELLWDTALSRLLTPRLDPVDEERFAGLLPAGREGIKLDCSAFRGMPTLTGCHLPPLVVLLGREPGGRPRALAIDLDGVVLRPGDGDAWEVAKLYAMMGASIHMVTCHHMPLHFPLDTINAITKSALPLDHPIRQLLEPHFRFSLTLNNSALHSPMSVLSNEPLLIYTPFPMATEETYRMTRTGYVGIPGNSGYPTWHWRDGPDPVLGDYGTFLRLYYEAILPLGMSVAEVVDSGAGPDPDLCAWGDAISAWLPGFPSGVELTSTERLGRVLTRIVWACSVGHAADHYDYGLLPIEEVPFRLRVAPPRSRDWSLPTGIPLATPRDAFRHEMARAMFFQEVTIAPLVEVQYSFRDPRLARAGAALLDRLQEVDRTLPVRRFVPLERIPVSVQF